MKQRAINYPKLQGKTFSLGLTHYGGYECAEAGYLANFNAAQANSDLFGDKFILLDYDALVANTETVMRGLAARIALDWHPSLICQTFNGMPIKPNSSFQGAAQDQHASILTEKEIEQITEGPMMKAYLALRPN